MSPERGADAPAPVRYADTPQPAAALPAEPPAFSAYIDWYS